MREDTLHLMFFSRADKYGDRGVLKEKRGGQYRDISWRDFKETVRDFARGLISLGLEPGDKIGILSENRPEWAYSDLAILSIGCVDVPIYSTDLSPQVEYILFNSEAKAIIVSNEGQLNKVLAIRANVPSLAKIIVMDLPPAAADKKILSFEAVTRIGREGDGSTAKELKSRMEAVKKDDLASIIYTSGTTGPSKGVCLTHDNFLSNCRCCLEIVPCGEKDINLSFLPLSHVFERMASYYFILFIGGTIAYAEGLETVPQDLREIRPTYICAAPRFYEKMYNSICETIAQSAPSEQKIFNWALKVARERAAAKLKKAAVGAPLYLKYCVASVFVFSKLKKAIGGRVRFFISGGAPLSKELAEFFYSVDLLILEGYGLTETSPVVSCNSFSEFRFGSVGKPVKGVKVKLASDGEILVSGPSVMKGYYKNEEATREVIDGGWFSTGDIGKFDDDGFLYITDRKKDIIITAGGKNIAPQNIENLLKADSYIQEVILHGDRRPYLTALIVPNFDALKGLALRHGIPYVRIEELVRHPRVYEFLAKRLEERQKDLPSYDKIKRFTLLERALTIEDGEITPTFKVKRRAIFEKYKDIFDGMYRA